VSHGHARTHFTYESGSSGPNALGLGEVCVPTDENFPNFSGFSEMEVNIATGDPQCASGVCVVNEFQGRVTCPDGNLDGGDCFTPLGEWVTVPVSPALPERPAEDAVFCSCRCDGSRDAAPFCECPRGMVCEPIIRSRVGESESYCIVP
jgi:hypothetical protein